MTFTGSLQVSGNSFGATAPDATLGVGVSTETPGSRALSAAVPRPSAGPGTALGSVSGPAFGTPVAKAEIGDCYFYPRRDAAHPVPTTHKASDEVFNPVPVMQDFRYLTYYVWSELPPPEKPTDIVLSSLKGTPLKVIRAANIKAE